MTTDLTTLDAATVFAEDMPDHAETVEQYAAAGLTRPEAFQLEARAARIITIGRRGILEIGQELLAARQEAKHGTWGTFLVRCGVEERTAQNYMRVAERFSDKPEMISALPPTALYALAAPSADPAVVGEIVEEVQAGSRPTVQEVKERLTPTPPAAPAIPHLPPDFREAQKRAEKIGLTLAMDMHGAFSLLNDRGSGVSHYREWPAMLEHLDHMERAHAEEAAERRARPQAAPPALTPRPTPTPTPAAAGEEEIAAAAPPAPPPVLTPLPSAAPVGAAVSMEVQARKILIAKQALLAETLALIEAELARTEGPTIVVRQADAEQAARLFLTNPALGGAAAMLAFAATVESEVEA